VFFEKGFLFMLRIGLVGSGFMGTTHAAAWANTPARLYGIYSADRVGAQKLAEPYRARIYDDLTDLLQNVDVVDICTPTHLHYDVVMQAARIGKHIVCEKPLARTAQQGQEMIVACESTGVHLLVGHVVRFYPQYVSAKIAVERGDIGSPAVLRLTRCGFKPGWATDNWLDDETRSGGMMLDLMIHDFDYARWVAGDVVSVFAKRLRTQRPDVPDDYAIAILRHRSGAISNIEGGWAYPPPLFRTALEIAGDAGLIEMPAGSGDPLDIHLKQAAQSEGEAVMLATSPLSEDPYTTQIRHFYDVLTGQDIQPRVTAGDALAALEIALAAIESARTGRQVSLEEVR
jgi:myo-inositol 2-dehydrogenase / D-chiro-inositol 1-dehydrogenase